MNTLWINARFLDRPITGVERVALEILNVLARDYLDARGHLLTANGSVEVKLLAPKREDAAPSPFPNLPLVRDGLFQGHFWEQLDLPRLTAGQGLLSLCNTGPMLKREHWLFLHDAQTFAIPGNFTASFRYWYQLLFRVAGRCARSILVNSHFTRQELTRFAGINAVKMHVCYPGSDHVQVDRPTPGSEALIPDEPYIIAFASSNPNKNFHGIAAALELLGDAAPVCVVVGADNRKVFASSKASRARVVHVGRIDDAALAALYRHALCLVFPSFYEGFGLPVVEAMAQGCPVVVSDTGSLPEVAGQAALYCNPENPATLAAAIGRIASSRNLRNALRRKGRARAALYHWRHAAAALVNALADGYGAAQQASADLPRLNEFSLINIINAPRRASRQ